MNIMNYTRREESWLPGLAAESRDVALESILEQLCDNVALSVSFLNYAGPFNQAYRKQLMTEY